jgi:hypothetical protein
VKKDKEILRRLLLASLEPLQTDEF